MTLKHTLLCTTLSSIITLTLQSIAGVTYMDHFDFETRYRNVYECDPFYWYPMHIPEHCMKIFERFIRKGIGLNGPTRIAKERIPDYSYDDDQSDFEEFIDENDRDYLKAPYQKTIDLLNVDFVNEPSAPNITFVPGLGTVVLYRQPVSKKSRDSIKNMAKAYKEYSFGFNPLYYPTTKEPISEEATGNVQSKINDEKNIIRNIYKKRGKLSVKKKKLKKGGFITILTNRQE